MLSFAKRFSAAGSSAAHATVDALMGWVWRLLAHAPGPQGDAMARLRTELGDRFCDSDAQCRQRRGPGFNCYEHQCENRHTRRGREMIAAVEEELAALPPPPRRRRKPTWDRSVRQGQPGFTAYATRFMQAHDLDQRVDFGVTCGGGVGAFAYQQTAAFLVHPKRAPVDRMLLLHRTGAGKTRTMIDILDNFFADPRPKVLIFPTQTIVNKFYQELFKFDNRYAAYARQELGVAGPMPPERMDEAVALLGALRPRAARRRHGQKKRLALAAPLRAFRYTIAGGATVLRPRRGERPTDPFFAQSWTPGAANPYSDKVVVMDELHNLLHPKPEVLRYAGKLDALKEALYGAERAVLVGATASPQHATDMLRVLKGAAHSAGTDEGFVSYFQQTPPSMYPRVFPNGEVEGGLPQIVFTPLVGATAAKYALKARELARTADSPAARVKAVVKLRNFANTAHYFAAQEKTLRAVARAPFDQATKLAAIARSVLDDPDKKTLVLVHRDTGFRLLVAALTALAQRRGVKLSLVTLYNKPTPRSEQDLARFNDPTNARGDDVRVCVADSEFYSEGIDFAAVRRLILADVPLTYADYLQKVGRVLRACVYHAQLPPAERTVEIQMYVATLPEVETVDATLLQVLVREREPYRAELLQLKAAAADAFLVDPVVQRSFDEAPAPAVAAAAEETSIVLDPATDYDDDGWRPRPAPAKAVKAQTVAQLKAALRAAGVEIRSSWRKPDLLRELAREAERRRE